MNAVAESADAAYGVDAPHARDAACEMGVVAASGIAPCPDVGDRNAGEGNGIAPRFPFGFGLSYTRFEQRALELSRDELPAGASLELSLLVRNAGERAGAEVVQAYVREVAPSVPRPPKELAAFAKVWLEAGEERRVRLSIAPRAFQFYDEASGAFTYRPGEFELLVGPNAAEVPLRRTFVVR